jgi:hypothetical protein
MKKIIFVALFAAFSLSSFASPALPSEIKPVKNILAAQTFRINEKLDISSSYPNFCTGEMVNFMGSLHFNIGGVFNENKFSKFSFKVNTQGLSGTGEMTGTKYQVIEQFHVRQSYTFENNVLSFTISDRFKIISAGSADNFMLTALFSFTINFDTGEFTIKKDSFTIECK